jgi:hypothetical protein
VAAPLHNDGIGLLQAVELFYSVALTQLMQRYPLTHRSQLLSLALPPPVWGEKAWRNHEILAVLRKCGAAAKLSLGQYPLILVP